MVVTGPKIVKSQWNIQIEGKMSFYKGLKACGNHGNQNEIQTMNRKTYSSNHDSNMWNMQQKKKHQPVYYTWTSIKFKNSRQLYEVDKWLYAQSSGENYNSSEWQFIVWFM